MIARAAIRPVASRAVARSAVQSRGLHVENTVYNNMPFSYKNKRVFAVKMSLFLGVGFALPFIAAAYQLKKSGGTTPA
ncbi:cytochrome c oxidase subunit VIIc [Dacryopinax primogenitus]|uniref:Cytochrome c oxidase subunit 8, mitochondrial n=1 Tax=Dacryopinax primogenitus (strain DJM 731) TaxID=1858805 RepID=M5FNL4_DACPD|nr:cytochrome c oxidase subunit VIIc [Dacryopinax primogenitus]EJT97650.1 cytochrome c oxidase subunit VIIc [Dacryopinax primogenitus]